MLDFFHRVFVVFLLFWELATPAFAATPEEWAKRSIYQIMTDRFALPAGMDATRCNVAEHTWCGGTWNTITENLDYVQDAGFTAVWISPINQNYIGPKTAYGDPYHGYWIQDNTQLNAHFGTADDLKKLSAELHKRGMFLMVDVVVNNVMSTSTTPDYSKYMFKSETLYHPYCPIKWGDSESEEKCWFGDKNVPLPDVDTQNSVVQATYQTWIKNMVVEYGIDGLRIDAAKHMNKDFLPGFCAAAGVFCIGEVYGGIDPAPIAAWQGPDGLHSVLNYPLYAALKEAFAIPGPGNMNPLSDFISKSPDVFHDTTVLGNFMENHDVPRWHNHSVDPQSMFNSMTLSFMMDGIPIVYQGQEQYFSGNADPWNREPLWPSGYAKTPAYNMVATLNMLRNYLALRTDWVKQPTHVLSVGPTGLCVMKGPAVTMVTNIGSPPRNGSSVACPSPYEASTALVNIFTCQQWAVGSGGWLDVEYTKGGVPTILVPKEISTAAGMCRAKPNAQNVKGVSQQVSSARRSSGSAGAAEWVIAVVVGLIGVWVW
ncbi:hypothetical protein ONZ45_g9193 [Pleurotus djamor]|nr:hypothetical protein ONZ45_g9193 [Pleurotus djamor]